MADLPAAVADLPKRYDAHQLLLDLWERDSEGEPRCFLCPFTIETCDTNYRFTVTHLVSQTWLREVYGHGAMWLPEEQRFRRAERWERGYADLSIDQIRSDTRNLVAARWWHHAFFDNPADSRHFKVPRDRLPAGFETFVYQFRAEDPARRKFGELDESREVKAA